MKLAARTALLTLVAVLTAGLSACGSLSAGSSPPASGASASGRASSPAPAPAATVPATARRVTCPAQRVPADFNGSVTATGQPVPAGFVPAAVVECVAPGQLMAGHGTGTAERKFAAVTGLGRLMSALRKAGDNRTGPVCITRPSAPWFVLIGRDGRVIRPQLPAVPCGGAADSVEVSLEALSWISLGVSTPPVNQTQ